MRMDVLCLGELNGRQDADAPQQSALFPEEHAPRETAADALPEKELQRLLDPLKLTLPAQPPPKITTPKTS